MKRNYCHQGISILASSLIGAAVMLGTPNAYAAENTLRIGQLADISSFDPYRLDPTTYVLTNLIYDKLIYRDDKGVPQPQLARSWELSKDGKVITFHLIGNAKFHDGRPLSAKDVAFSIDYAKNPANGANILPMARLIDSVEVKDPLTIEVHTSASQDVLYDLFDLLFILDSTHPDQIKTLGNGTGPFKLTGNMAGVGTDFVRYDGYWGSKPAFSKVELKILPDAFAAVAQMRSGSVDFLSDVSLDSLSQIEGTNFQKGIMSAENLVLDIGINIKKPPFDNPDVRQAVSLAIDRERIANEIGGPGAVIKCLPWTMRELKPEEKAKDLCPYDVEKAKSLIKKAGAQGASVEILTGGQTNDRVALMAQVMQASLVEIGLKVTITDLSNPAFVSRFRKSEFDLTSHTFGRAARSPATSLLSAVVFSTKQNPMGYQSENYSKAVSEMTTKPVDSPEVKASRQEIDKELLSQNWVISVASVPVRWASVPNLTGVRFTLDGMPVFTSAKFD